MGCGEGTRGRSAERGCGEVGRGRDGRCREGVEDAGTNGGRKLVSTDLKSVRTGTTDGFDESEIRVGVVEERRGGVSLHAKLKFYIQ